MKGEELQDASTRVPSFPYPAVFYLSLPFPSTSPFDCCMVRLSFVLVFCLFPLLLINLFSSSFNCIVTLIISGALTCFVLSFPFPLLSDLPFHSFLPSLNPSSNKMTSLLCYNYRFVFFFPFAVRSFPFIDSSYKASFSASTSLANNLILILMLSGPFPLPT